MSSLFAPISPPPMRTPKDWVHTLLPITAWLPNYDPRWFSGDIITGITVAIVNIPQALSYARLAGLPPQYGLYCSFIGTTVYPLLGTSKDVTLGPIAVVSLSVAEVLSNIHQHYPGVWTSPQIAVTLGFLCGVVIFSLGALRLGWLVEFIPAPAVGGFVTGSAIQIIASQLPSLLGIKSEGDSSFEIFWNTLRNIREARFDAVLGISGLVSLSLIRRISNVLTKKYPQHAQTFYFISVTRNAFVAIALTFISWIIVTTSHANEPIAVLGEVPRGFKVHLKPPFDAKLMGVTLGQLPVPCVVLLLCHIAIAKSFARQNNYKIDPDQELIAVGMTNLLGVFLASYPTTASFSATALKARCHVPTPLSGIFTSALIIFSLYALTGVFYYVPTAGLAAIIVSSAVGLVDGSEGAHYWQISRIEAVIWISSVVSTVFAGVQYGISIAILASLALLLVRIAKPQGEFLGTTTLRLVDDEGHESTREVFLPLDLGDEGVLNINTVVKPPVPWIVIYRLGESFTYPNASSVNMSITEYFKQNAKRSPELFEGGKGARLWNETENVDSTSENEREKRKRPIRAVIFDFASVSVVDSTGVQILRDTRGELERWIGYPVDFHFANIYRADVYNVLVAGGFGTPSPPSHPTFFPREPLFARETVPVRAVHRAPQVGSTRVRPRRGTLTYLDFPGDRIETYKQEPIISASTPFFHVDLIAAVRAAERLGLKAEERENGSGENGSNGGAQDGILIDL